MRYASKKEIERIRDSCSIVDIVSIFVQLTSAGVGAKKGLCPFHDEKTPSFTVRDNVATFHCFGCGESGDVFGFVMKINGIEFNEALEFVAGRGGININWTESTGGSGYEKTQGNEIKRSRILDVNRDTAAFFRKNLDLPEAKPARENLKERNFTAQDAEKFGCGYALKGRDNLVRHLSQLGYTIPEMVSANVAIGGQSGAFDRYQGRLMFPIRDISGYVLGFGGKKLYDDDFSDAKYINTSETPVYHKSKVLYGLDLARKPIGLKREVVIVEGYTDVMAMHCAGVDTAVASSGTAFGEDQVKILRRMMNDSDPVSALSGVPNRQGGKVIFVFDGDEAGQKAAQKTFAHDQKFMAQTYIVTVPEKLDPCDYRIKYGDLALSDLLETAVPSFEFMINVTVKNFDLDNAAGRIGAVRAVAPIILGLRDRSLRGEYLQYISRNTGVDMGTVEREVKNFANRPTPQNAQYSQNSLTTTAQIPTLKGSLNTPMDKRTEMEMFYTTILLQWPGLINSDDLFLVDSEHFHNKFFQKIYNAVLERGGTDIAAVMTGHEWVETISEGLSDGELKGVNKLLAIQIPISEEAQIGGYFHGVALNLHRAFLEGRITDMKVKMEKLEVGGDEYRQVFGQIIEMEKQLKSGKF
ncbi:DNA primase [Actinomycetota bacterium]|nr:DNA primase [Actinomycetota bacterium]